MNTYNLNTHIIVDPGYTLLSPYSCEYIYPGYPYYCKTCIHVAIMITYDSIAVNTYTLDTHTNVDPGNTLLSIV